MRKLIHLFTLAICFPVISSASDAELEEKLKAIMILFDQSNQELKAEVASLNEHISLLEDQKSQLTKDLESERRSNLNLKTEILVLESKLQETDPTADVVATELAAANFTSTDTSPVNQRAGARGRSVGARQGGARQGAGGRQMANLPPPTGDLLNINSASKDELLDLPLVNEFLADNIIQNRPWNAVEDLIQLQGFGPMKLRRLEPYITAAPVGDASEVLAEEIEDAESTISETE